MILCGFDEAGRGPLAGPVTAACVILPEDFPLDLLNDSKKLSEKRRLLAESVIKEKAIWGTARVEHDEIDRINILKASLKAMKMAFEDMKNRFPEVSSLMEKGLCGIADGTFVPDVPVDCRAEPKADASYPCVMAASILAKTMRDKIMIEYDAVYPDYGYKSHKGYPTKAHREVCLLKGPSPIQRLTFTVK
ncbi:MAG: ribonuclease HII [Treponema sp.]|nr:ribonuclease HII [Treponema sp.]